MKPIIASILFVLSGVASISYQLLWLRDAISHFGVITPVISVLLSIFMLGLAIGTYIAGRAAPGLSFAKAFKYYALVELGVAVLANCIPYFFDNGAALLLTTGTLESLPYLALSALVISLSLLPTCILIGATMPLMMRVLEFSKSEQKNFGTLYFANLIGALIGCVLPLFLIELYGMRMTLHITALFNILAACIALVFAGRAPAQAVPESTAQLDNAKIPMRYNVFLFLTGFAAIGSELLWVKALTPVTSSSVYAYAMVLGMYLIANIAGNYVHLKNKISFEKALFLLPLSALLIVVFTDIRMLSLLSLIFGIVPPSFLFGYLTPNIVDRVCGNNPRLASRAYMVNFAGCILGPLLTGYFFFPLMGLKLSFILHALLLVMASVLLMARQTRKPLVLCGSFAVLAVATLYTENYEDMALSEGMLHRDFVGYEAAIGKDMRKILSVNGIGMTKLTTITKNMIHLPVTHFDGTPHNILIICMGMGTTLRSAASWPFESITVAELSKGVTQSFSYFHKNAAEILQDPRVHIAVDDGRRFLLRNQTTYDIITLDPPPPMQASGSGLLYSTDFIKVIASRLSPNGILAHWIPEDRRDIFLVRTILSSISQNFKYMQIIRGVEGWGIHILASNAPIPVLTTEQFEQKLTPSAKQDLMEFKPGFALDDVAAKSLEVLNLPEYADPEVTPPLSDDRLYNEFFLLRKRN